MAREKRENLFPEPAWPGWLARGKKHNDRLSPPNPPQQPTLPYISRTAQPQCQSANGAVGSVLVSLAIAKTANLKLPYDPLVVLYFPAITRSGVVAFAVQSISLPAAVKRRHTKYGDHTSGTIALAKNRKHKTRCRGRSHDHRVIMASFVSRKQTSTYVGTFKVEVPLTGCRSHTHTTYPHSHYSPTLTLIEALAILKVTSARVISSGC